MEGLEKDLQNIVTYEQSARLMAKARLTMEKDRSLLQDLIAEEAQTLLWKSIA